MASSSSTTSKNQYNQQTQQSFQPYNTNGHHKAQQYQSQQHNQQKLHTEDSQESLAQNPTDPQKVLRYLLQDKTNKQYNTSSQTQQHHQHQHQHQYHSEMNTSRLEQQQQQLHSQIKPSYHYTTKPGNTNNSDKQQVYYTSANTTPSNQVSRSRSALGLVQGPQQLFNGKDMDKTFPANYNQHSSQKNQSFLNGGASELPHNNIDFISKSMDLNQVSPPLDDAAAKLIQSCLTFSGEDLDDDMNFLSHAMQPDKIFDLPMALLKVQKAFQNSNQNALKLKETLEYVLAREQRLLDKYEAQKRQVQTSNLTHEQETVSVKSQFKDQLLQFTQSVTSLQLQVQEKEDFISRLHSQLHSVQLQNQDFLAQLDLNQVKIAQIEGLNQGLQTQLQRKVRDFGELRQQYEQLVKEEQQSQGEIEKMQGKQRKEEQRLKGIIEDKNLLLKIQNQELECAKQERKMAEDQGEKMLLEIQKVRHSLKEDLERRYLDISEQKKLKDRENDELLKQLTIKKEMLKDLQHKYEKARHEVEKLEDQLSQFKKDITAINENNREALVKQRDSFEKRMKEMEDEITKMSLNRYKVELEQKQKFLKVTKKYDEQLRDLRQGLGYMMKRVGIKEEAVPQFLKDEMGQSLNEVRIENKEIVRVLEEFDQVMREMNGKRGQHDHSNSNWQVQYEQLLKAYKSELFMRRGLHNQLQELKGSIRVLCRVRPMLNHELKNAKKRTTQVVRIVNQHKVVVINEQQSKEQAFQFDRVFEQHSNQQDISEEVQQLVVSCLDGFNVCIMAYGQTGSGKTYTMIGDDENPGLYFSSVDELFNKIHDRKKLIDYEVGVSIVEIYNETLRDLLSSKKNGNQAGQLIKLRDNGDGETLSDQVVKQVKSKNQVLQCLREACMNRTVGMTHYNEQSSRSHFVFTLFVTGRHRETKDIFRGRLNLIDLAGSERILKSQAEGERIKEALNINQSLTTLGKVFLSLLNKASHIPYRDSKLTHYLKDSLGGESKTMLIIQVSPSQNDYGETVSSLNFGQRVACIEKGQIRATIESPNKYIASSMINKRSKSQNKMMEFEVQAKSVTPQNKTFNAGGGYSSFNNNRDQ